MNRKLLTLLISLFHLGFLYGQVETVSVNAKGYGDGPESALNSALTQAIGQVNGRSIDSDTLLTTSEKSTTNNDKSDYLSSRDFKESIKSKTKGVVESYSIISNAKDDPTFLMAEVEVVASYKLFNIKPKKLEHLIQKIFGSAKLDIQIPDRFGKPYSPQEWFMVPLQTIETAVEKIKDGTITRYRFDLKSATLIQRIDTAE